MAYDKLGPHLLYPTGPGMQWAGQASIVKQADGGTQGLRAAGSGAVTIWRSWDMEGQFAGDWGSGARVAQWALNKLGGYRPRFVEGMNEVGYTLDNDLANYIRWTTDYTRVMHDNGLAVAGFSFGVGWPQLANDDWRALVDNNFSGVDAISLHEYWTIGGTGVAVDEWWTLRYRKAHQKLIDLGRGNHPPFVITECGRDNMQNRVCQSPCPGGWLNQNVSEDQYLSELSWYNDRLKEDSYIIGGTPFTCSADSAWASYQLDNLVGRMMSGTPPPDCGGRPRCPDGTCPDGSGNCGGSDCGGRGRCWDGSCPDGNGNCPQQECNIPAPVNGCGSGYFWDGRPGVCRCEPCVQSACATGYHWDIDLCQCWPDNQPKPVNTGVILLGAGLLAAAMLALAYRSSQSDDYGESPPEGYLPVSEVVEYDSDEPPPEGYFRI